MTTLTELLKNTAELVDNRKIICHGTIRCIHTEKAERDILEAEGCDSVETGEIGNEDICDQLYFIANNIDRLGSVDVYKLSCALSELEDAYIGPNLSDYNAFDEEDALERLDRLISAAGDFVNIF